MQRVLGLNNLFILKVLLSLAFEKSPKSTVAYT
jgi:hypothetical protein